MKRIKSETELKVVFFLAKRNYKVYAKVGQTVRTTKHFVVVLDNGAAYSFKRLHGRPESIKRKMKKRNDVPNVRTSIEKAVPIFTTIDLILKIRTGPYTVNFLAVKKLETSAIFVCDFCDFHVKAINPRLTVVEMDDCLTVPINRHPSKTN